MMQMRLQVRCVHQRLPRSTVQPSGCLHILGTESADMAAAPTWVSMDCAGPSCRRSSQRTAAVAAAARIAEQSCAGKADAGIAESASEYDQFINGSTSEDESDLANRESE